MKRIPEKLTEEEKADFLADQKGYGQRYLQNDNSRKKEVEESVMVQNEDEQDNMELLRALYQEKNEHLEKFLEPVTPFEFYREIFPVGSFERKGHFEDVKGNGIAVTVPQLQGLPWKSRRKARPNTTRSPMSCWSCRRSATQILLSCHRCLTLGGGDAARMPGISMPWSLTWMGWVCPSSGTHSTR